MLYTKVFVYLPFAAWSEQNSKQFGYKLITKIQSRAVTTAIKGELRHNMNKNCQNGTDAPLHTSEISKINKEWWISKVSLKQ